MEPLLEWRNASKVILQAVTNTLSQAAPEHYKRADQLYLTLLGEVDKVVDEIRQAPVKKIITEVIRDLEEDER